MVNNDNNGLITTIWGPFVWKTLHSITFGYPIDPTDENKKHYKIFFESVGNVLPCKHCRDSYNYFINTEPTILDDKALTNRKTLTKWLYLLHERVNEKLGFNYGMSYQDVCDKYNSYRYIETTNSSKDKLKPYINSSIVDCPIIDVYIALSLKSYAEIRGINFDKIFEYNELQYDKNNEKWIDRNILCNKIKFEMKCKSIPNIESSGKFKGLPTRHELQLISMLSSSLSRNELLNIINNLPNFNDIHNKNIIRYKLILDE